MSVFAADCLPDRPTAVLSASTHAEAENVLGEAAAVAYLRVYAAAP